MILTNTDQKITDSLEQQIREYQAKGGKVQQVQQGVTAERSDPEWYRNTFTINGIDARRRFGR